MQLDFYIDGKLGGQPEEYRGLELELNFEDLDEIKTAIAAEKFTWVNDEADIINAYFQAGITGGLGVYWGLPLEIKVDNYQVFDGYIDLSDDPEFSCSKVIAKVREKKKTDWMDAIADGFNFDLLYEKGIITQADFVPMPYIDSDIPDYKGTALFLITSFIIGREVATNIRNIYNVVSMLSGGFTIIAGVLQLIFLVTYLVILIISLFKLIVQILELLLSSLKYHYGMMVITHFERACQYLGFTFSSSIFQAGTPSGNELISGDYANVLLLPEKNKPGFRRNKSTNQRGYFKGTFGDFIRSQEATWNAKHNIIDTKFVFERDDYGSSTQVYQIPDVRREFHGINSSELVSNYLLQFQIDPLDLNTINRYKGTNVKSFITSKISDPNKAELIKGFKQPGIPFALGRRKDELTEVEIIARDFLKGIDKLFLPLYTALDAVLNMINSTVNFMNKIIKAVNTIGVNIPLLKKPSLSINKKSFSSAISNRIGMLALSNDIISVPKLILITGSGWDVKVAPDNETKLSAITLWRKFHYIESFVPSLNKPAGKQAFIWSIATIPFCIADYYKIRGINNNNQGEARILSPEGNPARLLSLKWNIWQDTANIKYKEEKLYTTNLQETLIEDQGE